MAPDVGALVEYGRNGFNTGPGEYRVSGWLRRYVAKPCGCSITDSLIQEILNDERAQRCCWNDGVLPERFEWCLREEATHLGLSGICGAIAPVEEVVVTGMVEWTEELLAYARESAVQRGKRHDRIF